VGGFFLGDETPQYIFPESHFFATKRVIFSFLKKNVITQPMACFARREGEMVHFLRAKRTEKKLKWVSTKYLQKNFKTKRFYLPLQIVKWKTKKTKNG
jgi:hypothetical protein